MKIIKNYIELGQVAEQLKNDELVVIPTETVYGLAANALSETAVKKIFLVKGRPQDNPLIIHTNSKENIYKYTINQPNYIEAFIDKFMPGPLTLVLDKAEIIPSIVSAGLTTIGIRIPNNAITLELLRLVDLPLAAPSANKSGRPSPTKIEHIIADYGIDFEGIYACIDDDECQVGIESTIIKCEPNKVQVLRPGVISKEDIQNIIDIEVIEYQGSELLSPGMRYKHYSPNIPILMSAIFDENLRTLNLTYKQNIQHLRNVMDFDEHSLYDIYRNAESMGYVKINIIESIELVNNKGLFNRVLRSLEK